MTFEYHDAMREPKRDDPTEYIISAIVKGDKQTVKAEALSRGIKLIFTKTRDDGRNCWCLIDHRYLSDVLKWFNETAKDIPYPSGTMLHYSVLEA